MKKLSVSLLVLCGLIVPALLHAQKIVADKIIAQVGDQILLKSDIDNDVAEAKRNESQNGYKLPPNIECTSVQNHLMQKALMLQAQRDSLPFSDNDIDAQLDRRVRYFIQGYGSREALENVMGKSIYQFKEQMRPQVKEQMLAEQERGKITGGVKITPEEVRSYFDKIPKDSLAYYESQLEVSQIVIHPKASKDVQDVVADRLLGFKKDIESGKYKFEDLARINSQDPGVKENGGQYSINRLDKTFDPAFTSAAFRLKEGQISPVVESQFGLHLIQMVSKVGDDAIVRHILLIPPVSEIEIKQAVDSLESVRKLITTNLISFNAAVSYFSDDKAGKQSGGAIVSPQDGSSHISYDELDDKSIIPILDTLKIGEISLPQIFVDNSQQGRGQQAVRLVYLRSRTNAHRENLKDDFDHISERALANKQQKTLLEWFDTHISTFYVHLDKDMNQCSNLAEWVKTSERLELK